MMPEPRHLVLPDGIESTGWPALRETAARVGIRFDPWQAELNRAIVAKDADGLYAADTVVMSICRQSGKTFNVGGLTLADSLITPGTRTVWTAHRFPVARESFLELKSLVTQPAMLAHVDPDAITTAAGNECIPFRNGSKIYFKARERGAIRGFTKIRRLVIDEAQILTEAAMSDLAPTTNHAWNPQIFLMGTPPKPGDPSEVFTELRAAALEGRSDRTLYCEYSADDDADLDDWKQVAKANPSFPNRTTKRAVIRLRKLLTNDDDYAREGLGIWAKAGTSSVIDVDQWASLHDADSKIVGPRAFAIDIPPERDRAVIAVAGNRKDGHGHVEIVAAKAGTKWTVAKLVALKEKWKPVAIAIDPATPAGSLIAPLAKAGVDVELVSGRQYAQACGDLYDAIGGEHEAGTVRHLDQPLLNVAVEAARKRTLGDAWAWNRRDAGSDISPLVAITVARAGLAAAPEPVKSRPPRAMFV